MKRLLNTLYVTTQGAYLSREGETVLVRVNEETRLKLPIHTLDGIVCFGRVSASPPLMQLCGDHGVSMSFMSENGRFWGRVQGPVSGNVLLRREQYRRADIPSKAMSLARTVVLAKVANSRVVLNRYIRDYPDHPGNESIDTARERLTAILDEVNLARDHDELRGHEGDAAKIYFSVFDHLVRREKDVFQFRERSRRPPLDPINALLSFLYTLLAHDTISALEAVGLDPAVGFLHQDRPGRPSLALDLMEELRPVVADRLALSLINRGQVQGKGFKIRESGAVLMDDATRKEVLVAYQKKKQEELRHPFLEEQISVGLLFQIQARLMARFLRGDLDGYPPFFWK